MRNRGSVDDEIEERVRRLRKRPRRASLATIGQSALGVSAGLVVSLSIGLGWIFLIAFGTAFSLGFGQSEPAAIVMGLVVMVPTVLLAQPAFIIASKIGGRRAGVVAAVVSLAVLVSFMILFAVAVATASA